MELQQRKLNPGVIAVNLLVYALAVVFLVPFALSLLMSIKTPQETSQSFFGLPSSIHWSNFFQAAEQAQIAQSFFNSIVITVCTIVLLILASSTAGYAIGRYYHRRSMRMYQLILLVAMMIPFQTIMIPIYKMFRSLSLINTHFGVILVVAAMNLPFAVLLYVGFIRSLPRELEEAAMIDGYGSFRIFTAIVWPLIKPITMVVATLTALWTWNEFNVSLLLLQDNFVKTIPIRQYVFFGQYSSNYNLAFAAAVVSMIPVVLFFIIAQKYIVRGLTDGAIKG